MSNPQRNAISDSDTGERVTPVLDFPSRAGLAVQAVRVDYEPGHGTTETHKERLNDDLLAFARAS